jgi:hypothetical protein
MRKRMRLDQSITMRPGTAVSGSLAYVCVGPGSGRSRVARGVTAPLWVATAPASLVIMVTNQRPRPADNGDRRWQVASPSTRRNTFQKQEAINNGRNAEADA